MTRCDCCDLPVESCGKAAAQREAEVERVIREVVLLEPGTIEAKFTGPCKGCGTWVKVGDPIRLHEGDWMGRLCCAATFEDGE